MIIKVEVSGACLSSGVRLYKLCEKFKARVRAYDPATGNYRVVFTLQYKGDRNSIYGKLKSMLKSLNEVSDSCLVTLRIVMPLSKGCRQDGMTVRGCPLRIRRVLKGIPKTKCVDFGNEYRCVRVFEDQRAVLSVCRRRAITLLSVFGNLQDFAESVVRCSADELLRSMLDVLLRFAEDLGQSLRRAGAVGEAWPESRNTCR